MIVLAKMTKNDYIRELVNYGIPKSVRDQIEEDCRTKGGMERLREYVVFYRAMYGDRHEYFE